MVEANTYTEYPRGSGLIVVNFEGEVWGNRGTLAEEGDVVQCHACGRWFVLLFSHLRYHHLSADQYRYAFGLNRTQPLCSQAYSEQCSERAKERMEQGWEPSPPEPPKNITYIPREQTILRQRLSQPAAYVDLVCEGCGASFRRRTRHTSKTCGDPECAQKVRVVNRGQTFTGERRRIR